jgi:hypothetical protein
MNELSERLGRLRERLVHQLDRLIHIMEGLDEMALDFTAMDKRAGRASDRRQHPRQPGRRPGGARPADGGADQRGEPAARAGRDWIDRADRPDRRNRLPYRADRRLIDFALGFIAGGSLVIGVVIFWNWFTRPGQL